MSQTEKKITVKYFARLKEEARKSSEELSTICKTPAELFAELSVKYNLSLSLRNIRVAINQKYSSMNAEIVSGDEIVFIPPVAGG